MFLYRLNISHKLSKKTKRNASNINYKAPYENRRLLTKIVATGVDWRVVMWIKEFFLGRSQRVRVNGQLSEEVRVTSGVPQGSALGPLLFLAYINDIWRNTESNIQLFADDCIIYGKITNSRDFEKLQKDLIV